jgi:hypothetical protein
MDRPESALVRSTLLTLSYTNREAELDQEYPKVLALLSYSMVGVEEGLAALRSLSNEKIRLRLVVDADLANYYSMTELMDMCGNDDIVSIHSSFDSCSHFILPILPFFLVSKIVNLDDQHPFTKIIFDGLFKGKKVSAISIGANPNHEAWRKKGYTQIPSILRTNLQSQLQVLRSYGIEMLEYEQLSHWLGRAKVESNKKKVISQEDIILAHTNQQNEITVDSNTIMTPLAIDLAKDYAIEIKRK